MNAPKVFYLCVVLLLSCAFATEVTVTLQNGVDGYSGCVDSYVDMMESSQNYGSAADLKTQHENYPS